MGEPAEAGDNVAMRPRVAGEICDLVAAGYRGQFFEQRNALFLYVQVFTVLQRHEQEDLVDDGWTDLIGKMLQLYVRWVLPRLSSGGKLPQWQRRALNGNIGVIECLRFPSSND